MESDHDTVVARIAGAVVLDQNPGIALKAWRERLGVKQSDLASCMKVSPSVLSDYESGRRLSPGVGFVRRYVEALASLDKTHNKVLEKLAEPKDKSAVLAMGEFHRPFSVETITKLLDCQVLSGESFSNWKLYGYTVVDSIKAIYALSGFDFYRIFGATTERVIVFVKVGMGRSPLVAIRVSQLKPRMVVLHGPQVVDPLAVDLAKREAIVFALSKLQREEEFEARFSSLQRE
jgi:putative transcriptional regulator